eukprot:TRINITY_DN2840_c0_g2_i2.p1 TRINITY_DN2840_c0_g2~~TRINITY_DN2840_c0_g2_i2.p1  ORF type:complete len:246 (+),score=52.94 TRINITY_DN2840_c0_g2_i2:121-858(+)
MAQPQVVLNSKTFLYNSEGKGVLYALGCAAGGGTWVNPCEAGVVQVSSSGVESGLLQNVVAFDTAQGNTARNKTFNFNTTNVARSWIEIRLPEGIGMHVKGYQFSRGSAAANMRNWVLYGTFKEDGGPDPAVWYPLAVHQDDNSIGPNQDNRGIHHRGGWRTMIQQRMGFHRFRIVGVPFKPQVQDDIGAGSPYQRPVTCTPASMDEPVGQYFVSLTHLELFGTLDVRGAGDSGTAAPANHSKRQ